MDANKIEFVFKTKLFSTWRVTSPEGETLYRGSKRGCERWMKENEK